MDLERTMQFIVENQAAHAARMDALEQEDKRLSAKLDQLTSVVATVVLVQKSFIEEMRTYQQKTDEQIRVLGEKIDALAERVNETTENVNALIKVVDGIIRQRPSV